jgi:hypothetical protein
MMHKAGRWYADWRDGNDRTGKRHRKGFTSRKAALRFQSKMRNAEAKKAPPRPTPRPSKSRQHGPKAARKKA